jgi:ATP-dependent RNA helicase RhlE
MEEVLVFTRTKHRADRLFKQLVKQGLKAERIHGNRSQAQRTEALGGFRSGKYRVLVATDIAAGHRRRGARSRRQLRCAAGAEDYIHRVGRTARARGGRRCVSPSSRRDEEGDLKAIERALGSRLPRVTLPDFDYKAKPEARLEGPDRRADRRDPGEESRRQGAREGKRRASCRP